ncbi:MAG: pectinesterase family protein [Chthoniobacteraceae bacterium]
MAPHPMFPQFPPPPPPAWPDFFFFNPAAGGHRAGTTTGQRTRRPTTWSSADGSGQYKTVQEAINASPQTSTAEKPWTIFIKPGIYQADLHPA